MTVNNAALSAKRSSGRLDHFCGERVALFAHTFSDATVVGVTGELDACNMHHLTDCAHAYVATGRALVLDLSQLDFLAAQGITTLFDISDECAQAGVKWVLVTGHAASRLLRICDPDQRLPVVSSIDEALQRFSAETQPQALLQLVAKAR